MFCSFPSASFKPHIWRQSTIWIVALFVIFCTQVQTELSFAPWFGANQYYMILILKVLYFLIDLALLEPFVSEMLIFVPFDGFIEVINNLTTMGAPNFVSFVLSYFVGLFFTLGERLYIAPMVNQALTLFPKWMIMLRRRLRGNKRMTRFAFVHDHQRRIFF